MNLTTLNFFKFLDGKSYLQLIIDKGFTMTKEKKATLQDTQNKK
jgi:hypothetical protein